MHGAGGLLHAPDALRHPAGPVKSTWNESCEKGSPEPISHTMTPNDPARIVPPTHKSATAPPYVDEDPNLALVEQGLEAAENEIREAVADSYESAALRSPSEEENLDDIDFTEAESPSDVPELSAMRLETLPEGEREAD